MPYTDDPQDLDWRETLAFERRRATETAMWSLPGASLAAQAFLYTRGLDPNTTAEARLVVALVGLVTALATIQILLEQGYRMEVFRAYVHAHRRHRNADALSRKAMLREIETIGGNEAERVARYTRGPIRRLFAEKMNAPLTWLIVMLLLASVDVFVVAVAVSELSGGWAPFSNASR